MTVSRADALARLDVFVGEWVMEAQFPGGPPPGAADGGPAAHAWFEWALDGQFLLQRTTVPDPAVQPPRANRDANATSAITGTSNLISPS